MSRNIILLTIILLVGLLVWCWWMLRIEAFSEEDKVIIEVIQNSLFKVQLLSLGNFALLSPLFPYLNVNGSEDYEDWTYDFGVTGATGPRGNAGIQGVTGAQGGVGSQGVKGRDGSSIFDVSKYMLNGDTDIFKKKNKKDDDNVPQPVNAHTTLFD